MEALAAGFDITDAATDAVGTVGVGRARRVSRGRECQHPTCAGQVALDGALGGPFVSFIQHQCIPLDSSIFIWAARDGREG